MSQKPKNSLIADAVRKELERRKQPVDSAIVKLRKVSSDLQWKFVTDPSRFKLIRASRQSGKTYADAIHFIYTCLTHPNSPTLYLGLTRESAKEAIWLTLITILETLGIQHSPTESALRIKFPNGSFIQLFGADTGNIRNRLRGRKFKLVVADEMGFFSEADDLIKSLLPTLSILQGSLAMTSSPGLKLSGLFYEADQGREKAAWSRYQWNLYDNPSMQGPATDPKYKNRADEELDTICRLQFGGNRNNPTFRREFLGEWVRDATTLIYPYEAHNTIPEEIKVTEPQYGIGVNLSNISTSAICVVKFSPYSRDIQVIDTWKETGLMIDEIAQVLKNKIAQYGPVVIIGVEAVVEELSRRYEIQVQAADMSEKTWYQRVVANDLVAGFIRIVSGQNNYLLDEWASITKDKDGHEIKGPDNQAADAFLFIYQRVYNTYLKHATPKLTEEQKMIAEIEKIAIRESRKDDDIMWDFDDN